MNFFKINKTSFIVLFFSLFFINTNGQIELIKGWNTASEIINQIEKIKQRVDFKYFKLSTYNAKDDIYNLLTGKLVQRANSFKITNELEVVQLSKIKSDRNSFYIELKIKQYISGAGKNICRNNEYTYTRKLYIIPDLNLVTKRATLKPYFDNYNMTAEACFAPGKKYVSNVRDFKNNFKRNSRELENYYINQFSVNINLNTEGSLKNFSNTNSDFKKIFWKRVNNVQNYKREDFLREVENYKTENNITINNDKNNNEIKPRKRKVVFVDNFNDNKNKWSEGINDNNANGFISNGAYYWVSKTNTTKTTTKYIYLNQNKDFEISGKFKIESSLNHSLLNSLVFGGEGSKRFYFGFTKKGSYRISYYDGTSYIAIKNWSASSYIEKNGYNILTLRKTKDKMYFYINNMKVYSTNSRSFFGNNLGFQAASNSKIKIEYLTVTYLE